jgi:hypothetical protein
MAEDGEIPMGDAWPDAGEAEAKLARYRGPAFRKAYLESLLEAAARFRAAGNPRGAGYCLGKVAAALADALPDTETGGSAVDGGKAPGQPPDSHFDRLRAQWRSERLSAAENILSRHGGMLSALEYRTFGDKLGKLRQAAGNGPAGTKADSILLELRRRLYARVLKSRKVALKRKRMPVSLARIAMQPRDAAGGSGLPVPVASAQGIPTQPPIGPYNDRLNMEDILTLVAEADATWVEEFLDLFRGLAGLKGFLAAPGR